jgi:hypothetical protein
MVSLAATALVACQRRLQLRPGGNRRTLQLNLGPTRPNVVPIVSFAARRKRFRAAGAQHLGQTSPHVPLHASPHALRQCPATRGCMVAAVVGIPRWHARGQGFKSPQLHHHRKRRSQLRPYRRFLALPGCLIRATRVPLELTAASPTGPTRLPGCSARAAATTAGRVTMRRPKLSPVACRAAPSQDEGEPLLPCWRPQGAKVGAYRCLETGRLGGDHAPQRGTRRQLLVGGVVADQRACCLRAGVICAPVWARGSHCGR